MIGIRYHVSITDNPPMPPDNADLCIRIDFTKSSEQPRRVFDAISLLIEGFERLDDVLIETIDAKIEPILLLEDVEAGSIRVWLKNILKSTDDDALKTLDWRPQVGKYLVRAKYATLRWLDTRKEDEVPRLVDLKSELQKLAEETDARHLPDYPKVHDARLVPTLDKIQDAKRQLRDSDRLIIEAGETEYQVDLTNRWSPSREIPVDGGRSTYSEIELILTLRKPDMLGQSKWVFRHGKSNFTASIEDSHWLSDYYNRRHLILPGDALRCTVKIEYLYDRKGQLKSQNNYISKIHELIPKAGEQTELF
jgi:hypothetical protein